MEWLVNLVRNIYHSRGTGWAAAAIVLLFFGAYIIYGPQGNNQETNVKSMQESTALSHNQTEVTVGIPSDPSGSEERKINPKVASAASQRFDAYTIAQESRYYKAQDNGYVCAIRTLAYDMPNYWYVKELMVNFEQLAIEFRLSPDTTVASAKPLAFSLGDESLPIFRILVADGQSNVIGIESVQLIEGVAKLVRHEDEEYLDSPIKPGTNVTLVVRAFNERANVYRFVFTILYLEEPSGEPANYTFPIEVELPFVDVETNPVPLGFGTLEGNCILPIAHSE